VAHQEEIEAASENLQPCHAGFDNLCHNVAAYERQSTALFAESAFAPFRPVSSISKGRDRASIT
jgi:hypothetical protein